MALTDTGYPRYALYRQRPERMSLCVYSMRFKHHEVATPFRIYNVHLEHKGKEVCLTEMRQILSDIAAQKEKFILTGGFNAAPDSSEMQLPFAVPGRKVCEAIKEILHTFHGFGTCLPGTKIDYVFTDFAVGVCHAVEDKGENRSIVRTLPGVCHHFACLTA